MLDKTLTYHYDLGGNLTAVKEYAFTTEEVLPAQPQKTETGTYSTTWKDQLLSWDGTAMTYDAIGNMLTKGSASYTWTQGRKLSGVENGKSIQYFYDHTGARTKKVVDGTVTEYRMAGDLLVSEKTGTQTYWYRYDSGANLVSVTIGGEIYFYVRNAQNDVIALIDGEGNTVVEYTYDSWGKVLGITGSLADTVGVQNPFRYRGYYYDSETGMYYLKSRYYDPGIRRFLCADTQVNDSILGTNLYAYCENEPIGMLDSDGNSAIAIGGGLSSLGGVISSTASKVVATVGAFLTGALVGWLSTRPSAKNYTRTVVGTRAGTAPGTLYGDYLRDAAKVKIDKSLAKVKVIPWYKGQNQRHHIVAQFSVKAQPAREILGKKDVDIGIDSDENTVLLKRGLHQRLHNNLYYAWVNTVICSAYDEAPMGMSKQISVSNQLEEIQDILEDWNKHVLF